MTNFLITSRNRVRRLPDRGLYDRQSIYQIIDEALVCHVGFIEDGQPLVIPIQHARQGDRLLFHGARGSRLLQHIQAGEALCISMAIVDGLVLAKSAFHHSTNYRSVVLFGKGYLIENPEEKLSALECFTDRLLPGRWQAVRPPNPQELHATALAAVEIEEASAKLRNSPPNDDPDDIHLPAWAGLIPIRQIALEPIKADYCIPNLPIPDYAEQLNRDWTDGSIQDEE